jgi:MtN3 and saliva related transmembrane protein
MQQLIGISASLILLATIVTQIARQWAARTSKGVSKWLFVGQLAASTGFAVYSYLLGDRIFLLTNALMAVSAVVGLVILRMHRRAEGSAGEQR